MTTNNIYLNILDENNDKNIDISDIVTVLNKYCSAVNFRRLDETEKSFEATFFIETDDFEKLTQVKRKLRDLSKSFKITIQDNKGIVG